MTAKEIASRLDVVCQGADRHKLATWDILLEACKRSSVLLDVWTADHPTFPSVNLALHRLQEAIRQAEAGLPKEEVTR